MSHVDRSHNGIQSVSDWSLTTWYENPLFRNWMERPDASSLKNALYLNQWEGDTPTSLWALRAALAQFHWTPIALILGEAFDDHLLHLPEVELFAHSDLRSRFLRGVINHSDENCSSAQWSERIAKAWPWLWYQESQAQGMGEAHPFARLIRADHINALELLWSYRPAKDWVNWTDPKSDRMTALMIRTGSAHVLSAFLSYDPSWLQWKSAKDQKTLLHEACSKLRPELAQILLEEGLDISARTQKGLTVGHEALAGILGKTQTNILNQKKTHFDSSEQLFEVLGRWHFFSQKGLLPEHQVLDELLLILDPVRLSSMRSLLQRIALSNETSTRGQNTEAFPVRRL